MIKTNYKEVFNEETGKWENVKVEVALTVEEIKVISVQSKKGAILQIQDYLSKTDNKVRRYERQVRLGKKTKYTEEEILTIEETRELETIRIETLEQEILVIEQEIADIRGA